MALDREAAIAATLIKHLMDMPGRPAVAEPNKDFTPPQNAAYLRMSFQPNRPPPSPIEFGAPRPMQGIFQISVFWPGDQGIISAFKLASAIAEWFAPRAMPLSIAGAGAVLIEEEPSVGGHMGQDDESIMIPVTVFWRVR